MVDRLKLEHTAIACTSCGTRSNCGPTRCRCRRPRRLERRERWATSVLPMAAERGLEMRLPPVAPRTRLTHQAVEVARDQQRDDALRHAIFVAFFRDSRDIGDANVLADLGESVGVDRALLLRALADGHICRA